MKDFHHPCYPSSFANEFHHTLVALQWPLPGKKLCYTSSNFFQENQFFPKEPNAQHATNASQDVACHTSYYMLIPFPVEDKNPIPVPLINIVKEQFFFPIRKLFHRRFRKNQLQHPTARIFSIL